MSADKKADFEAELLRSSELKSQLDEQTELLKEVISLGQIETGEPYFNNLLPGVRLRLEAGRRHSFYPGLALGLPILAVIVILIIRSFSGSGEDKPVISRIVSGLNDESKTEILVVLFDADAASVQQTEFIGSTDDDEILAGRVTDELKRAAGIKEGYLDTDELINNLSKEETETICNNLITKKIF